jgi:hypothetical protein
MRPADSIEKLIKKLRYKASTETHDRVLGNVFEALDKFEEQKPSAPAQKIRVTIMKNPITKLAAAAVIIIAVLLSTTYFEIGGKKVFEIGAKQAYALEQIIKANHAVRTVHCRIYESTESLHNNQSDLCWIRYNDAGLVSNLRWNHRENDGGVCNIIWNEGIYKNWNPLKNVLIVDEIPNLGYWEYFTRDYDPKRILERLYVNPEDDEAVRLIIREPIRDGEPIYVEATHIEGNYRAVLLVDPETKLVKQYSTYDLNAPEDDQLGIRIEYLAYDQPIDESVFELNAIPDDARVYDYANQITGLEQGDLTDHEIAVKVVRTALEAVIAQDYDEACKLMEGEPERTIEEFIEATSGAKRVQLISIGKPYFHKYWSSILCVPCEIEVENEKGTSWIENITVTAKKIRRPGNRWMIAGENPDPTDSIMRETVTKGTIIPGVRVGDFTLGMSKDDVLDKLGKPNSISWKGEEFTLYNLPSKYYMGFAGGIYFLVADSTVRVIGLNRPFYKFANGLGVGDSEQDITQAFGDDFQLNESPWRDQLIYKDKGLKFEIHKESRIVTGIDVCLLQ